MEIKWDLISAVGFGAFVGYLGYNILDSWEPWVLIIWLAIHGFLPRNKTEQIKTEISHRPLEQRKAILRNYEF